MKEQQQGDKQQATNNAQRDDIRNSDKFKENQGGSPENHPGEDRVAKTEREGWGQQQSSGGHPINS